MYGGGPWKSLLSPTAVSNSISEGDFLKALQIIARGFLRRIRGGRRVK
jgi:hypothetical protein